VSEVIVHADMIRCRRLLRAKSFVDLTIVVLVLCVCVFIFRHVNNLHRLPNGDADVDTGGQLLEISLNDQRQQQQRLAPSPAEVDLRHIEQTRHVDPRIMRFGDFRSADCRTVSRISMHLA